MKIYRDTKIHPTQLIFQSSGVKVVDFFRYTFLRQRENILNSAVGKTRGKYLIRLVVKTKGVIISIAVL